MGKQKNTKDRKIENIFSRSVFVQMWSVLVEGLHIFTPLPGHIVWLPLLALYFNMLLLNKHALNTEPNRLKTPVRTLT